MGRISDEKNSFNAWENQQGSVNGEDTFEGRLARVEADLAAIHERNNRVSDDKAWEISPIRRGLIATITFCFASLLLFLIENQQYLRNAAVPTAGYLLSTLTLPKIKKHWLSQRGAK